MKEIEISIQLNPVEDGASFIPDRVRRKDKGALIIGTNGEFRVAEEEEAYELLDRLAANCASDYMGRTDYLVIFNAKKILCVTVEIPIHPDFLIEHDEPQNEPQNGPQNEPPNTNPVEDAILQLIRMNKHVTREEMASQMEVSLSTVKRAINKLKTSGIIEYEGPSKGGYWIIKQ